MTIILPNNFIETYALLKNKYTVFILNDMLYNSEISLDKLKDEDRSELTFETLDWLNYANDHEYKIQITSEDISDVLILTRICSEYLDIAVETYPFECGGSFTELLEKIFIRECYIDAIIEYTELYATKFKDEKLLQETLKFFENEENKKSYFQDL